MSKQPCRFFNSTGKCRFGKHCRFLHEVDYNIQRESSASKSKDEIPVSSEIVRPEETPSSTFSQQNNFSQDGNLSKNTKKEALQRPICKFYATDQNCRYGKSCRFQHVQSDVQDIKELSQGKELIESTENDKDQLQNEVEKTGHAIPAYKKVSNGVQKAASKIKNADRRICRFYKQGNCRAGKDCKFKHESFEQKDDKPCKQPNNIEPRKPVSKPQIIRVFKKEEISEEKLKELHQTEITQFKRRFPADRLKIIQEADAQSYVFTFTPTDPDWPFDVKTFEIRADFGNDYPLKVFNISLPADQDLPETVRWSIEKSLKEWCSKQQRESDRNGTVELLFRPFLRWMDRNMEDIVTEGLKQLRRELQAQAAGIQFVSAKDLKKESKVDSDEDSDQSENSDQEQPAMTVYRKSEIEPEEVYEAPHKGTGSSSDESTDDSDAESDDDDDEIGGEKRDKENIEHRRPKINPDTERQGTEMSFRNMRMWFCTTVLVERLHLAVQCERCKTTIDFTTPPNRANSLSCSKCHASILVAFRATLAHSYSSTFGYLDMDGCTAFDVMLQNCHFSLGCISCHRDILVKKMTPGKILELWCRGCHAKMQFAADSVKLTVLASSAGVDTSQYSGNVHNVNIKKQQRVMKDPSIQEGKPLPENGSCKHYKKSYRWLRFPCCGKTYPCDICHDSREDHEMILANRMICGFCCKEQRYAAERPCIGCSSALTKVKTTHWEGGRGCRNKTAMGRNDVKKFSNLNKTMSNKAKALKEKSKGKKSSSAKLSTAKNANK